MLKITFTLSPVTPAARKSPSADFANDVTDRWCLTYVNDESVQHSMSRSVQSRQIDEATDVSAERLLPDVYDRRRRNLVERRRRSFGRNTYPSRMRSGLSHVAEEVQRKASFQAAVLSFWRIDIFAGCERTMLTQSLCSWGEVFEGR
jgi:hypothetical protein